MLHKFNNHFMVDIYEKPSYNITNVSNRRSFAVLCRPQNSVGDRIFARYILDPPDPMIANRKKLSPVRGQAEPQYI